MQQNPRQKMQKIDSLNDTASHARKKAMSLLERQDRTEAQLRQKLQEQGYTEAVVENAIDYVKSFHYIDDKRYAENYICYRQDRKSKQQLKMELAKKGVCAEIIQAAMEEEYDADERNMIRKLLEKKQYHKGQADAKETNRVMAYLLRRGFSYDDIQSCMRNT